MEKISETLPQGVYLTNLSLRPAPKEAQKLQVSLAGFCPTRDILSEFKKRLEAVEVFKEIDFPPSNWLQSKDIDFYLTLKLQI